MESELTATSDPCNDTSMIDWSIIASRAFLSSSVISSCTIAGWTSASLLIDAAKNISTLVFKANCPLASNSSFYNSSLDTTLTALSTTSSGTWSLVASYLNSSYLFNVFRYSIITYSRISYEAYPSKVASFFVASSSVFFFIAISALALLKVASYLKQARVLVVKERLGNVKV